MNRMKTIELELWGETNKLNIVKGNYVGTGNLALELWDNDGPFATLTTNISKLSSDSLSTVDTNNCPWAEQMIRDYKLGYDTGRTLRSGFCEYPIYKFDLKTIKEYEVYGD